MLGGPFWSCCVDAAAAAAGVDPKKKRPVGLADTGAAGRGPEAGAAGMAAGRRIGSAAAGAVFAEGLTDQRRFASAGLADSTAKIPAATAILSMVQAL